MAKTNELCDYLMDRLAPLGTPVVHRDSSACEEYAARTSYNAVDRTKRNLKGTRP